MRINSKSFFVSLALVTFLATSASAAVNRTPNGSEPTVRAPRDLNPIVRVIKEIKRRISHAMDQVAVPPPQ